MQTVIRLRAEGDRLIYGNLDLAQPYLRIIVEGRTGVDVDLICHTRVARVGELTGIEPHPREARGCQAAVAVR